MKQTRPRESSITELHVAPTGNDGNPGTVSLPLRTIQRAAEVAYPGCVVVVHEGIYRERIDPPRGGRSDVDRIVFRAAPGERVVVKGSEPMTGWRRVRDDVWKVEVPNEFFGDFNPYNDLIGGDWFNPKGRKHHTGAVYVNGGWMAEAAELEELFRPVSGRSFANMWFAEVDNHTTTIWAQFSEVDPNSADVEINVRRTVFYPSRPGVNYLTISGFVMEHAATPWAPPTAEQIGLVGTHWSKGWVVEENVVRFSVCAGIALGKYGDEWDNSSEDTAEGYVQTIERALAAGWSAETVGGHVVRNNVVSHCEQAGIVGSLGAAFSTVTGNVIHDIHVRKLFSGAEMAAIKFHAAIDTLIRGNHIYRSCLGLWLDWMAQGTRVSRNLFHDNERDVFVEVNHGPFVLDNNILLSQTSLRDDSDGGAYVHNLICGVVSVSSFDSRQTPYLQPHSTQIAGFSDNKRGDDRFFNNVFGSGVNLSQYDGVPLPMMMGGNIYLGEATPSLHDQDSVVFPGASLATELLEKGDGLYLRLVCHALPFPASCELVTTDLLGNATVPGVPFENPDGSVLRLVEDYLGVPRDAQATERRTTPGPFAAYSPAPVPVKIWPCPRVPHT